MLVASRIVALLAHVVILATPGAVVPRVDGGQAALAQVTGELAVHALIGVLEVVEQHHRAVLSVAKLQKPTASAKNKLKKGEEHRVKLVVVFSCNIQKTLAPFHQLALVNGVGIYDGPLGLAEKQTLRGLTHVQSPLKVKRAVPRSPCG
jgi:hypothetical protein